MRLKSLICTAIIGTAALVSHSAYADVIGEVLSTDITAYIDEQPIESFNINDYTYVIAEDLRGYGFNVDWNGDERTLNINRNRSSDRNFMPMDKVNIKKSDVVMRKHAYDVYSTDIVTYLGGEKVNAYNVDGQTLIMIDELQKYGIFDYNDGTRSVRIDMAGFDEENLPDPSERQEITLSCEKDEGSITFSGDVTDGKPDGYGVISEHYEFTNGLKSTEDYYTSGDFSGNKRNGYIYYHGKKTPHNGSDRRVRDDYTIAYCTDGTIAGRYGDCMNGITGYYLNITKCDGTLASRTEKKGSFKREITIDDTYRYGYRVDSEGYTDSNGILIDYGKTEAGKIVKVSGGSSASYIIDDKGDLYGFGDFTDFKKEVPVKLDSGIRDVVASEFSGYTTVIDTNGNMYYLWDKIGKYKGQEAPVAYRNVKKASEYFFLTEDKKLYRRPVEFSWTLYDEPELIAENVTDFSSSALTLMYETEDGSLYSARLNNAKDSGTSYNDDYDLSAPIKISQKVSGFSANGGYFVVDGQGILHGWSSPYYKTQYEGTDTVFKTQKPIAISMYVTDVADMGTFIAMLKSDNGLYVCPNVLNGDTEGLFGIKKEQKILSGVSSFSLGFGYVLAVKEDGTLWVWGRNNSGSLGISGVSVAETPVQIADFYTLN